MAREARTARKPNPVSLCIFSFAAGIFLSSFVPLSPLVALWLVFLGAAVLVDRKKEVILLSLALISFGLGSLRYGVKDFHDVREPTATGVVVSEPEDKESVRRFVYEADNGEKVLVSAPPYTEVEYGDRVRVEGSLKRPEQFDDFDYPAYLAKDDIYWTASFAEVEVLNHGEGNALKAALLQVKGNFISHIERIVPEPESGLLSGLLVAGKGTLPEAVLEDFRRAGIVHIVVLSGFNITLIAEFLRRLFRRLFILAQYARFPHAPDVAALMGVALFVLMTGGEATVVRAALMASVAIAARLLGRNFSASRALFFAAFLMLIENPKILVHDPSFQLSFLATLGLIFFCHPVERRLGFLSEKYQLREIVAQTLATQAAVFPLLVYSTGSLSLVSLPANILILPLIPLTMIIGFAAALLSYVAFFLAWPLALVSHLLLSWPLFLAHLFASFHFAVVSI